MNRALASLILVPIFACATSPSKSTAPPTGANSRAAVQAAIAELRDQIAVLTNRVNHLNSELLASRTDGEFKRLTIDEVRPSDSQVPASFSAGPMLLCHVVEWDGYGRMLRFTRLADRTFTLESPGHPAIDATMAQGGVCNDSGSTRFVMLDLERDLEPGVAYSIRPRNDVADYRWVVNDGVQIHAAAADRHAH